jgi:hypothetical protein
MMQPPSRVIVGPFPYVVLTDPKHVAKARRRAHDGRLGETDTTHLQIMVDAELPVAQVRDTVLHEVLHAVTWTVGGWRKGDGEDDYIGRVSPILLDTLRRNPQLVAYLTAEDEAP